MEEQTVTTSSCHEEIETRFHELAAQSGRKGIIGFCQVEQVRLLPEQRQYLETRLAAVRRCDGVTAASIGLRYREEEIRAVPSVWTAKATDGSCWSAYADAYSVLNAALSRIASQLAERFGGVAEPATLTDWAGMVEHVTHYFPHCVSHRAFAEAAGLGWRGRHRLLVTPEAGPALRLATVFLPGAVEESHRGLVGCRDCQACIEVCPVLSARGDYREACRKRIIALALEQEVCGICVRVCWEQVKGLSAER
jgi:epoxyqueuosine reductase QueG